MKKANRKKKSDFFLRFDKNKRLYERNLIFCGRKNRFLSTCVRLLENRHKNR